MFWSEIGSEFGEQGAHPLLRGKSSPPRGGGACSRHSAGTGEEKENIVNKKRSDGLPR